MTASPYPARVVLAEQDAVVFVSAANGLVGCPIGDHQIDRECRVKTRLASPKMLPSTSTCR